MELTEELSIGSFSRVSGLTVKALRHYDEIGLLKPARVDEWTATATTGWSRPARRSKNPAWPLEPCPVSDT